MVFAAIGGMQLNRWTDYARVILPTLKVLRAAKRADGCVEADTFKQGDVFFAVSVWADLSQMKAFARSGLHGQLSQLAMDRMAMFHNHTAEFETPPSRAASVAAWLAAMDARGGNGTVGSYRADT